MKSHIGAGEFTQWLCGQLPYLTGPPQTREQWWDNLEMVAFAGDDPPERKPSRHKWVPGPIVRGRARCGECGLTPRAQVHRVEDDESTALPVPELSENVRTRVERAYRAAVVLDENGHGDEAVDEIMLALQTLIPYDRRQEIESEVENNPEAGLEGG